MSTALHGVDTEIVPANPISTGELHAQLQELGERNDRKRSKEPRVVTCMTGLASLFKSTKDNEESSDDGGSHVAVVNIDFSPKTDVVLLSISQLSSLTPSCRQIVEMLDSVTHVHAFIGVPAQVIKLPLVMLSKLSENDQRIEKVVEVMKDMYDVVGGLRQITRAQVKKDGGIIERRLTDLMTVISNDVRLCIAGCDTYIEKNLIIRFLLCFQWEQRLTEYIETFNGHRVRLNETVNQLTLIKISVLGDQFNQFTDQVTGQLDRIIRRDRPNAATDEASTSDRISTHDADLQSLRSPEELTVLKYIQDQGGPKAFYTDEKKMADLIQRCEGLGLMRHLGRQEQDQIRKEMMRELKKSFADMVRENQSQFGRKLEAQRVALEAHIETVAAKQGDRIIKSVTGGPHERILDPDMYTIWKDMGWRGTTKARSFVMAVREYYAELAQKRRQPTIRRAIGEVRGKLNISHTYTFGDLGSEKRARPRGITSDDAWTLEYITISRIQPLLEAFDNDASGLVSVSEVNAFTSGRPDKWSLPYWIAYWTAGFPLTVHHYFGLIQLLMARIPIAVDEVLPVNRSMLDYFTTHWCIYGLDILLAGICRSMDNIENDSRLFQHHFKGYVDAEEKRLTESLERVAYCIDAENTLFLITGSDRVEKHVMVLVYLILLRFYRVVQYAKHYPLHTDMVISLTDSLSTILLVFGRQMRNLKALYKLQNVQLKEQLARFAHGICYYLEYTAEVSRSSYWSTIYFDNYSMTEKLSDFPALSKHLLLAGSQPYQMSSLEILKPLEHSTFNVIHPPQDLDLDPEIYDTVDQIHLSNDFRLLVWSGRHLKPDETPDETSSAGFLHLDMPDSGDTGVVVGTGCDDNGDFDVDGEVKNEEITFRKIYKSLASTPTRYYRGTLDSEMGKISGIWGYSPDVLDDPSPPDAATSLGRFQYSHCPIRFPSITIDQEVEAGSSRARALWRYAIRTVIHATRLRSGRPTWEYLQERRNIRKQFIQYYSRLRGSSSELAIESQPLEPQDISRLAQIEHLCSKQDIAFYKQLADILARRRIIHWHVQCDHCGKSPIPDTRLQCLVCSNAQFGPDAEEPETYDLCNDCMFTHDPSHSLLQLRKVTGVHSEYARLQTAIRLTLETLEQHAGSREEHCYRCSKAIHPPFWLCLSCNYTEGSGSRLICMDCKAYMDRIYSPVFDLRHRPGIMSEPEDANSGEVSSSTPQRNASYYGSYEHPHQHTLILVRPADYRTIFNVAQKEPLLERNVANLTEQMATIQQMLKTLLDRGNGHAAH